MNRSKSSSIRERSYGKGQILVAVYRNEIDSRVYYDTVIYRRIRQGGEFRRGTNLKPHDLPLLVELLSQAGEYLVKIGQIPDPSDP